MGMMFCRGCGGQIHESAQVCPHCGAGQNVGIDNFPGAGGKKAMPWLSIASLIVGILCALSLFDESDWDRETTVGLGIFAMVSLGLGIASVNREKAGRGMAIAGIVLSVIAMVVYLGLMSDN